jgi:hypothetical protein
LNSGACRGAGECTERSWANCARGPNEIWHSCKEEGVYLSVSFISFGSPLLGISLTSSKLQESKLYGAHFKEIPIDAPKSKKITFDNSDDDD